RPLHVVRELARRLLRDVEERRQRATATAVRGRGLHGGVRARRRGRRVVRAALGSLERLERQAGRDDALAGALVDDVDRVVLPVGAGDAEEEREPAPEAELPLARQLALEDERVPLPPEVLAGLLEHAVDVDLERVRGVGGE